MTNITFKNKIISISHSHPRLQMFMTNSKVDLGFKTTGSPALVESEIFNILREEGYLGEHKNTKIIFPQQVHGNVVKVYQEDTPTIPITEHLHYVEGCDGIITNTTNLWIGSQYADCTPVVLYDAKNHKVAAIHSGWRGTLSGITKNALEILAHAKDISTNLSHIHAYILPAISYDDFEVDIDVYTQFNDVFGKTLSSTLWSYKKGEKYHINTQKLIEHYLETKGVKVHKTTGFSTFSDKRFHSYRRDREKSGRMLLMVRLL